MTTLVRGYLNTYTKFFSHFGVGHLKPSNSQYIGDCPFPDCEKPNNHFFVGAATGMWDCKFCKRRGNLLSFMREYHSYWQSKTIDRMYRVLADRRNGIPQETFKEHGLAFDQRTDSWLLPSYSSDGTLSHLYAYRGVHNSEDNKYYDRIVAAPTFKHMPIGVNRLHGNGPLYINEGQWDYYAWYSVLWGIGVLDRADILGVPGSVYPRGYFDLLHGRDLILLFDNDEAGSKGMEKLLVDAAIEGCVPASVQKIVWPDGTAVGYDIRDAVHDAVSWQGAYDLITYLLKPVDHSIAAQQQTKQTLEVLLQDLHKTRKNIDWMIRRVESIQKGSVR